MAAPKGPPPKAPPVNLDELAKRWEADKKSRLFLQLAEEYRKHDQVDKAVAVLKEGLKHHVMFAPAHVAMARCLLAKGQLAQAQAELEPIVAKHADNLLAGKLLAEVLQERGERSRALKVLEKLLPFAPDDEEVGDRIALLKAALGGRGPGGESSGETAEFSTSDYTGEGKPRAAPAAPAVVSPTPVPLPRALTPPPAPPVDEGEPEVVELLADDEAPLDAAPPMPMPVPAMPADDLLGAPLLGPPAADEEDEFTSVTLAELYEAQGGHAEAAKIYERLLGKKPGDVNLQRALDRCRARTAGIPAPPPPAAAATPPPPGRPRWEPVRPREAAPAAAPVEEPPARPSPAAAFLRPSAASAPAPGSRAARLRATRAELRRWLVAVDAVRSAR